MLRKGDAIEADAALKRRRRASIEAAQKALAEKAAKAAAREAEAARAAARALIAPAEMFKPEHDGVFEREVSYGSLDEEGVPLTDAAGEELSKSARKKLGKQMAKQAKLVGAK